MRGRILSPSLLPHLVDWDMSPGYEKTEPGPHTQHDRQAKVLENEPWNLWSNSAWLRSYEQFPSQKTGFLDDQESGGGSQVVPGPCCPFQCRAQHWWSFGGSVVDETSHWSPGQVWPRGHRHMVLGLLYAPDAMDLPENCSAWGLCLVRAIQWETKSH